VLTVTEIRPNAQRVHAEPVTAAIPQATLATLTWEAQLSCDFEFRSPRTVLARRQHRGPLLVQRPFYPEGPHTCHLYLVHPPGGIAGGDQLRFDARLHPQSQALITTPAATKLYRSNGPSAQSVNHLQVASASCLEWLPQETIIFSGAQAKLQTRVELAADARFLGWEIVCLGRSAREEVFDKGQLRQSFEIYRDGQPIFIERSRCQGGDAALREPWGLQGDPVFGTFVCVTRDAQSIVEKLRAALSCDAPGRFCVTALSSAIVCRYIGPWAEGARAYFMAAWRLLRPWLLDKPAIAPRIWAT